MACNWCAILALAAIVSASVSGSTHDRGPVCFHCSRVTDPSYCTTVRECWPSQQCYTEHVIHSNGSRWYDMGCKLRDECNVLSTRPEPGRERNLDVEIELCDQCCEGDLCNSRVCFHNTNNTGLIRCLECENVDNPRECSNVQTCQTGEICLMKQMTTDGPHMTHTMGCLSKAICAFLNPSSVGKRDTRSRERRSSAICQQCCATDTCNINLCSTGEQITFPTDLTTTVSSSMVTSTVSTTRHPDTAKDCWDLKTQHGVTQTGTYTITAPNDTLINVRCDMGTDGGGWTVLQRRVNDHAVFDRNWDAYKSFFGDLTGSFWMGNDLMSNITKANQTLRVDLCDSSLQHAYAIYRKFSVADESDGYRLHVESYSGTAGDALIQGLDSKNKNNEEEFSTLDHPSLYGTYCPQTYNCGWWFGDCFGANLNGVYIVHGTTSTWNGIQWTTWRRQTSLIHAEMKIRPMAVKLNEHSDNDFICHRP